MVYGGTRDENLPALDYSMGDLNGRYTSPDEFKGGPEELFDFEEDAADNPTFYADLSNPQSLNKYQYGYNNPYKYNDPSGHCPPFWACLSHPAVSTRVNTVVDVIIKSSAAIAVGAALGKAAEVAEGALRASANAGIGDTSCPACGRSQAMGQSLMNKSGQGDKDQQPANSSQAQSQPVATGVTAAGRKTDKKGRPIGPSSKLMQHGRRPSTRKKALEIVRNKKGASGIVRDNKNQFKGKKVDNHLHPVDRKGKRIEKDKSHTYLPKKNQSQ